MVIKKVMKFLKRVWNAFKLHEEHTEAVDSILNTMDETYIVLTPKMLETVLKDNRVKK